MAFEKAAILSDLGPGRLLLVELQGKRICLGNAGGTLFAIANDCTHMGGSLSGGDIDGSEIECPLHGSRFDVTTGEVTNGPARRAITRYEVRTEGDEVQVDAG